MPSVAPPPRQPIVLLSVGSFNPITRAHLDMFRHANAQIRAYYPEYEVVGNVMSPVHDWYLKKDLLKATYRVAMCRAAAKQYNASYFNQFPMGTPFQPITVDAWESKGAKYLRTVDVLRHVASSFRGNASGGGSGSARTTGTSKTRTKPDPNDSLHPAPRVFLLCGQDLIDGFFREGWWTAQDMRDILTQHGVCYIAHDFDITSFEREELASARRKETLETNLRALLSRKLTGGLGDEIHVIGLDRRSTISSTSVRFGFHEAAITTPASSSFEQRFVAAMQDVLQVSDDSVDAFVMPSTLAYVQRQGLYLKAHEDPVETKAMGALVREIMDPHEISPHEINRRIEEHIKRKYEGVCSRFGFVKKDSITVARGGDGVLQRQFFNSNIRFDVTCHAMVARPAEGDKLWGTLMETTDAGWIVSVHDDTPQKRVVLTAHIPNGNLFEQRGQLPKVQRGTRVRFQVKKVSLIGRDYVRVIGIKLEVGTEVSNESPMPTRSGAVPEDDGQEEEDLGGDTNTTAHPPSRGLAHAAGDWGEDEGSESGSDAAGSDAASDSEASTADAEAEEEEDLDGGSDMFDGADGGSDAASEDAEF